MKTTYQAILFTPNGEDYVTDFHGCKTKDEVWSKINDMGSRWYFYPIAFVITENCRRVVDCPDIFQGFERCSIKTIQSMLKIEYDYDPTYWIN